MAAPTLHIGLMSGTSLDGVDGVLARFEGRRPEVLAFTHLDFPAALRAELFALQAPGPDELHRSHLAGLGIADLYAQAVATLLKAGKAGADEVAAIGAHGQTVRHRPELGYTIQLLAPARLAEKTGIRVVADFRSRDIAAGGQGAPLVPAFHQVVFSDAESVRIVVNVGGIANLSILKPGAPLLGFDCGPGNVLMDAWTHAHTGRAYDEDGRWAATGHVRQALLTRLLAEPYLATAPPKSTGRDLFNGSWLAAHLASVPGLAPVDVQATLLEFTAACIADAAGPALSPGAKLFLCGGGARNVQLLARLRQRLSGYEVQTTDALGVPVDQVEALAFAWLARCTLHGEPGNVATVTGAAGPRLLGAIYPA